MSTNRMPPQLAEVVGRRAGDYKIERLIGEGGMGSVYFAIDRNTSRRAAVKVISMEVAKDEALVDRFLGEAKAMAALDDPNVITIYGSGRFPEDGRAYIVMQYVDGQSLEDLCTQTGPMPVEQAALIVLQAASALEAVHVVGIIHRDIKPQNVLVWPRWGRRYFVTLVDFGIAKLLNPLLAANYKTRTFAVMGTAGYMPPEQARGEKDVDVRADVYSLGATMYRMLAGRTPYHDDNPFVMWEKQINNHPVPMLRSIRPDVPVEWEQVIHAALSIDRTQRPGSMKEFAQVIARGIPNGELIGRMLVPRLWPDMPSTPGSATISGGLEQSLSKWASAHSQTSALQRRRFPVLPVALSLVAGVAIGGGAIALVSSSHQTSRANEVVANGSESSNSGQTNAPAGIDAAVVATAPVPATVDAAPAVTVDAAATLHGETGSATRDAGVAVATAKPAEQPKHHAQPKPVDNTADAKEGVLVVRTQTWAEVWVDGTRNGTAPVRLTIPVGPHKILLVNDSHRETVSVTVSGRREAVIEKNW